MLGDQPDDDLVVPDSMTFIDDWRPRTFDIEEFYSNSGESVEDIMHTMDKKWNMMWKRKMGDRPEEEEEGKGSSVPRQIRVRRNQSLAQTFTSQAVETHACNAAHIRMRDASTDFYALVDGEEFTDHEFPTNDAIYW